MTHLPLTPPGGEKVVQKGVSRRPQRPDANVSRYDFRSPRLYVEEALSPDAVIAPGKKQSHYLRNVLRRKTDDAVLLFNGRDGEWRAILSAAGKTTKLVVQEQVRPQSKASDLHYLFAPLKHERLDYLVQKAVEMGVSRLQPILTQHTQVQRVNIERMQANAIEAAEQCGILTIPEIAAPVSFARMIAARKPDRLLVFCDEDAELRNAVAALSAARVTPDATLPLVMAADGKKTEPMAILVGPEGGFTEDERATLLKLPNIVRLSLGPRILRADTAAVAALALVQAVLGDWR